MNSTHTSTIDLLLEKNDEIFFSFLQIQQPLPQQQPQPIQLQHVDRYCMDCDIRFTNTKTFRAHKEFYCGSRHRDG